MKLKNTIDVKDFKKPYGVKYFYMEGDPANRGTEKMKPRVVGFKEFDTYAAAVRSMSWWMYSKNAEWRNEAIVYRQCGYIVKGHLS